MEDNKYNDTGFDPFEPVGTSQNREDFSEKNSESNLEFDNNSGKNFNDTDFLPHDKEFYKSVKKEKREKKKFSVSNLVLCSVVAAIIAGLIGSTVGSAISSANYKRLISQNSDLSNLTSDTSSESTITPNTVINVNESVDSVIEAVAAKVTPSVVGIVTTAATTSFFGGNSETTGQGSGIIYTADGYIITNYHVIESVVNSASSKIEVYLASDSSKSYNATVVGYNISYDLAVIKISDAGKNLPAVELADASSLKVGQFVAAIGNPGGIAFMGSVTYGIISGLNRVVSDSSSDSEVRLIQTDAAINPGNSGGALVNTKGQLIGVNSSKIAATDYEGMGFAIPVDTVKDICDKIISKENDPNPYIGITLNERYTSSVLNANGFPSGAVVRSVVSGGPAEQSGIKSGDIIVEFNGVAITEYSQLSDEVSKCSPGNNVTVKIYRNGRYYSTSIKVGSNNSQ